MDIASTRALSTPTSEAEIFKTGGKLPTTPTRDTPMKCLLWLSQSPSCVCDTPISHCASRHQAGKIHPGSLQSRDNHMAYHLQPAIEHRHLSEAQFVCFTRWRVTRLGFHCETCTHSTLVRGKTRKKRSTLLKLRLTSPTEAHGAK